MNQDYYNEKKSKYHLSGGREIILRKLIPAHAKTVLDIGCGSGELAKLLHEQGKQVWGADISLKALEDAKPYLAGSYCFDIQDKTWPTELMTQKFDVVVASEVIEHIFTPSKFLAQVKKILAPGGSIVITTPNILFWKNRLRILGGSFRYTEKGIMDFGHIRLFTIDTLRELFEKAGFEIDKEQHFYPNLYNRGLNFLGAMFPGVFAYQFGIKATSR